MRRFLCSCLPFPLMVGCIGLLHGPEGINGGECEDKGDNDVDGLFDCDDPDCFSSESCADGSTDTAPDTDSDTVADTQPETGGGGNGGTGGGGNGGTGGGDADTDTDTDADIECSWAWAANGVNLTITNGSGTYLFGMAEEVDGGWYGEDGLDGPGPNSGDWDINHDSVSSTGITLTTVTQPEEVVANSTTLLTNTIHEAGHLAYLLYDASTGECWEQNDDSALDYYDCR